MIDTHAHLNIDKYKHSIDEVIKRANDKGVNQIIVIGMDLNTSIDAIKIANQYEGVFATVGIHPGFIDNGNHLDLDYLYKEAKVIAVGEIGLDYYWRQDNKELQREVFIEQIEKAIKLDLPVIIHTRDSFDETYEIVKRYEGKLRGVFHCFSSNLVDAKKVLDLGLYIGIDGPVTFKKSVELHEIAKEVPLNKILIETDSPYLTPEPYRGKSNEPKNVYYVALKIAELRNIPIEKVIKQTTQNAQELFRLENVK